MASPRTVSLVLGAGGARGLCHIGVIEWLERNNYVIDRVVGCSMGAVVGGIYAAGKLETYTRWVLGLTPRHMFQLIDFAFTRTGLVKGERLMGALRDLIGDCLIEDLETRFVAVATDLEREREVRFSDGSLFDALRASIAIPALFTPHAYRDMQLLDGGLVNPLPVDVAAGNGADVTIAVNLNGPPHRKESNATAAAQEQTAGDPADGRLQRLAYTVLRKVSPRRLKRPGLAELAAKSLDIMQSRLAEGALQTYPPDAVVEIPRDACAFYEFHRAAELIELGKQRAEQVLSGLRA